MDIEPERINKTRRFLFVRHAKTRSNIEKRYSDRFDESLCSEGIREAEGIMLSMPDVDAVVAGTALRCRQTAAVLFPEIQHTISPMTEIDFGVFAGKSADDLRDNKEYEKWLSTGCTGDIPGGGSFKGFRTFCCNEFMNIVGASGSETTALVLSDGNIMSILGRFVQPKRPDFFSYHLKNCGFILCRYENGALYIERDGQGKRTVYHD